MKIPDPVLADFIEKGITGANALERAEAIMDLYITGEFDQERYDALAKRFTLNFGGVLNG